jgi:DNA polymerase-4
MADSIFRTARDLLRPCVNGTPYRLIGVSLSDLCLAQDVQLIGDFLDPGSAKRADVERTTDAIRAKFGNDAIIKGRSMPKK